MVFKSIRILLLWTRVAPAFEGLRLYHVVVQTMAYRWHCMVPLSLIVPYSQRVFASHDNINVNLIVYFHRVVCIRTYFRLVQTGVSSVFPSLCIVIYVRICNTWYYSKINVFYYLTAWFLGTEMPDTFKM